MAKNFAWDSAEIVARADKLMEVASNRYRIVVQIARRAKRCRYEEQENGDGSMLKPVMRAVLEMSDELTEPEILRDHLN
ncbi:DNA-directed RNA polymerase, omega subunit [Rippkaea orientalis PCC 8801]|uniref:DNA-directed RNA polymerase subunit omega n=1 Tax=Rippkaea orientalis (strain PCC 8801 / RF-1) TaxID=41431 RepID=B7K5X1_RIPO1|nr:DNA-directed RNA polymerase subunit omega [Rippkaea orientalis]ACK68024.1 DNA-directed RNA polymerase, omega subunit [Rippkaea orientalis PCC 8801]